MSLYRMPDGKNYEFASDEEATKAMGAWQRQFVEQNKPTKPKEELPPYLRPENRSFIENVRSGAALRILDIYSGIKGLFTGEGKLNADPWMSQFKSETEQSGGGKTGAVLTDIVASAGPTAFATRLAGPTAGLLKTIATQAPTQAGYYYATTPGDVSERGKAAALAGAGTAVAIPVVHVLGKAIGGASDLAKGKLSKLRAKKILADAIGEENIPAAKAALGKAKPGETTAQAIGEKANYELASLEEVARREQPTVFGKMAESQAAKQGSVLSRMARGETQAGAMDARKTFNDAMNARLNPLRVSALDMANKNTAEMLRKPVQEGIKVDINFGNRIFDRMKEIKFGKGEIANDLQRRVLSKLERNMKSIIETRGYLDAYDLHGIRKYGINNAIEDATKGMDKNVKDSIVRNMPSIRAEIDKAIEEAGGKGWTNYLKRFSKAAHELDQLEMTSKMKALFDKGKYQEFINIAKGQNTDAVEDVFGKYNYDFTREMGKRGKALKALAERFERDLILGKRSSQAMESMKNILERDILSARLPRIISRPVVIANTGIEIAEKALKNKATKIAFAAARDPKLARQLLDELPSSEKSAVIRLLTNNPMVAPPVAGMLTAQDRQ